MSPTAAVEVSERSARPGVTAESDSLYAAEQKVYPRQVIGRFSRLRGTAAWILLGLYYLNVWWQWNGRQAFLFDLPTRKFYVLGVVFWPQDFIFLTGLLIIAALSLFFFTALGGRLWCGYACPQTVWTEVFLWMERFAEGDRSERMKLDRSALSFKKALRKSFKQFLWITFALWTGFTFVGYFTPVRSLAAEVWSGSLGSWETFWILFYGLATYANAGYLREQVCKYMCPYARFQGAMIDRDTLVITYDAPRGEPRGARRRAAIPSANGLGSCIDCTWCVQVCPTGIDIRKGLQPECIACAACIDACDSVMDRMNYPRGLIRYTTEHAMTGQKTRILRPRIVIYGALLVVLITTWTVALCLRKPFAVDVIRDRNALYRFADDGSIENVYDVKIINKAEVGRWFVVTVAGTGSLNVIPAPAKFYVGPGEVFPAGLRVRRSVDSPAGSESIQFTVAPADDLSLNARTSARFIAPNR